MYPIPANATRIRYLESTGTQYIDTGVLLGQSGKVVEYRVGFAYTSLPSSTARYSVCGSYGSNGTRNGWLTARIATSEYVSIAVGSGTKGTTIPVGIQRVDCVVTIDAPNSRVSATSSGTGVLNTSFSGGFPANNNYLFARSGDNGGVAENMLGRIYYYDQYVDGTLVRSFVPVRVGQVGYLFDRVTGQLFGNAGTGDFVLGPDTFSQGVVPTRMMVAGVRRKAKPSYLQANGIVWIDTGVPVSMNYAVRCKYQVVSFGNDNGIAPFGFWYGTGYYASSAAYSQRVWSSTRSDVYGVRAQTSNGKNTTMLFSNLDPFAVHDVYAGFGTITVDGNTQTGNWTSWTTLDGEKQHLFGCEQTNPADQATNHHSQQDALSVVRIWSASWTDSNGNLVRDFVPAEQNGQAGMLDRVTNTFYGPASASTGAFSLGYD